MCIDYILLKICRFFSKYLKNCFLSICYWKCTVFFSLTSDMRNPNEWRIEIGREWVLWYRLSVSDGFSHLWLWWCIHHMSLCGVRCVAFAGASMTLPIESLLFQRFREHFNICPFFRAVYPSYNLIVIHFFVSSSSGALSHIQFPLRKHFFSRCLAYGTLVFDFKMTRTLRRLAANKATFYHCTVTTLFPLVVFSLSHANIG